MSAAVVTRRRSDRAEWQSFLAVILVTVLAIGAGLAVLSRTADQSRRVERAGISVDLPTSWIVADSAGDLILSAYDPLNLDLRYTVAGVAAAGRTPDDVARTRLADRRSLMPGFAIVDDAAGKIGDVATHRIVYTFAPAGSATTGLVQVREDYVADGDRVLVIGLEAPRADFAAAESAFDKFARQVIAGRTGATGALAPATAVRAPLAQFASLRGIGAPSAAAPAAAGDLVAATVQIFMLSDAADPTSAFGTGSGTIISANGLILTNAHVAKPTAGGLGVQHVDPTPEKDPAGLVIAIVGDEAQPPVPRYRASLVAVDGYLDAALLQIDRTLDGASVAPGSLNLPFLPVGDSDALHVGDKLTIVGFPGIGGNTISLSSGQVSGFLGDSRLGARAWVKTDAVMSFGNSGGLAANEAGELVGVPTRGNGNDTGGFSEARPAALIKPMIAAAIAGRPSLDSAYVVAATGSEAITLDTWTDNVSACQPVARLSTYPSGARQVLALFKHTGMADGEDVVSQWSVDGEVVYRAIAQIPAGTSAAGCLSTGISLDRGLPDGAYRVEVFAGPNLKAMASAATSVGTVAGGGTPGGGTPGGGTHGGGTPGGGTETSLSGRVVDVDSGQPLPNAGVFLLTPGTDPRAWLAAPSSANLVGVAETGADGRFTIGGLTAGTSYPAIVAAEGYLAAIGTIGPVGAGAGTLKDDIGLVRAGP